MPLRSAVARLLVIFALLSAADAFASDPAQPSNSESAAPAESAQPAESAENAQALADEEAQAEEPAEDAAADAASKETSLEEAATQAQNVEIEQGKPFDPAKASRKELDEHNAGLEPDQKIKCVQAHATGSRRPTKVCMTQAQWRQSPRD